MAFEFGKFHEFSDSVTIGDPVLYSAAKVVDLGPFTGNFYQKMGAPAVVLTQKEFEIYSRSKTSRNGVIGATAWGASATTGLSMPVDVLKGLTVGHVLRIDGEVVIIKNVDRTNNTIDVLKRAVSGTAKAHAASTPYKVIGFAGNDDDLEKVESMSETTRKWSNYVQTVYEVINWNKHGELVRDGMSNENAIAFLLKEAEIRVAEILSSMAINGIKYKDTNAGDERYMSAGLLAQLSDSARGALTYNVNGLLSETKLDDTLKMLFNRGGVANTLWVSTKGQEYLDYMLQNSNAAVIVTDKGNTVAGNRYVKQYNYHGQVLSVEIDSEIPDDTIAVVNQADCKKGWLKDDGLRMVDEPVTSSRKSKKSIQGTVGFMIENVGSNHALLTGITGASDEKVTKVFISNTEANPVPTKAE